MESREEIESMRVVDLREFLKRHGRPSRTLVKADGTPGPVRKSDLLTIALQIHDDAMSGKPSPQKPAVANPFQSGLQSTPDRRRRPSGVQVEAKDDGDMPEKKKESNVSAARARRRSSVWIDPSLLAKMQTPTKAVAEPVQRNGPKRSENSQKPQRVQFPPPPVVGRDMTPKRVNRRFSSVMIDDERVSKRDVAVRNDLFKEVQPKNVVVETPDEIVPVQPKSAEVKLAHRHTDSAGRTPRAPRTTRRSVFDVVEEYVSDEDPDFDVSGEEADDEEDGYVDDEFDEESPVRTNSVYADVVYESSSGKTSRREREERVESGLAKEDIVVDSDYASSDHLAESDPGSTVDTEDEVAHTQFANMSLKEVRAWLREHGVPYRPMLGLNELVSLARAHVLHLQATEQDDDDDVPQIVSERIVERPFVNQKRDGVVPNLSAARSNERRRRRIISAPIGEDSEELVHLVPKASYQSKRIIQPAPVKEHRRPRRMISVFSFIVLFMLTALLVSWAWNATMTFLERARMTYCDSGSETVDLDKPCKPCPANGVCSNGTLKCHHGFMESKGKCEFDDSYAIFVDQLASDIYKILRVQAGLAQCGEIDSPYVTIAEVFAILQEKNYRGYKSMMFTEDGIFQQRAVERALKMLQDDFVVQTSDDGSLFSSNEPIVSLRCRFRQKLWEYKKEIFGIFLVFAAAVYVRIRLFLKRQHERKIQHALHGAIEVLRDQLNGFRDSQEDVAYVTDVILREEIVGSATPGNIKFWKEVEERLKRDARVMRRHQVIHGMPSYTYEYIGRRRSSIGMSPGGYLDSLSRRSSFGSRASLDSLDFDSDRESVNGAGRQTWWLGRFFQQQA